jgi:hypothetical protein
MTDVNVNSVDFTNFCDFCFFGHAGPVEGTTRSSPTGFRANPTRFGPIRAVLGHMSWHAARSGTVQTNIVPGQARPCSCRA